MRDDLPNIRHMRVFLEACDAGSVSMAAARCHLSQPAATQAISRLEQSLGAPLLIRRTRQLTPTPIGALFADRVRTALDHLAHGARLVRAQTGDARAGVRGFDRQVTSAQLRALVAVAELRNFTVAAHSLGLSQPSVYRAARTLEELSGASFFRATAQGVELTAAAQTFVLRVKLAQSEIRQGIAEIGHALGEDRGTIVLASLPLARTSLVPQAVHRLISGTRGVQVRVVDGPYSELLRGLREGDIDCMIGALRLPPPADDVTEEPLFMDPLVIVAHPSHPLASRRGLSLADTLDYPWVAPPRDTPAGRYLFETLRIEDMPQTPVRVVSSSLVMLRGILAQGPYLSIISRHQISYEEHDGRIVPLDVALTDSDRAIGLTYRSNWRPTPLQAQFLDHLRHFGKEPAAKA